MKTIQAILISAALAATTGSLTAWAGGSNIGGSDEGSRLVTEWCRGNLGILAEARRQADLSLVEGDRAGAIEALKQGMRDALTSSQQENLQGSLTYRALTRGLDMTAALEEATVRETNGKETIAAFLVRYYDFVTDVANKIDLDYQIPYSYRRCGSKCPGFDIQEFERRFVRYAADEVRWVLDTFAFSVDGKIYPKYSSKAYLKLLELATGYLVQDLSPEQNLWSARYACLRQDMNSLSQSLAHYNAGNHSVFRTDPYAVNLSYSQASHAIETIDKGCSGR